jgi:hypothetical protein
MGAPPFFFLGMLRGSANDAPKYASMALNLLSF